MHITVWKYAEKQDKEANYMRRKFRKILALTTAIAVVAGVLPLDGGALSSKITNGGLTVSAAEFTSPETGNGVTPEEDPEVTFSDNDASVESAEALFTDNDTADNEGALQDGEEEITVQSVQNLIDALPSQEEVSEMSFEEQEKVYEKLQNAYEAYETLAEEEKSQLTGTDVFDKLFDYFNGMVSAASNARSGELTVTQNDGNVVYNYTGNTLTINNTESGEIEISGSGTTTDRIVVKSGTVANIILKNVDIRHDDGSSVSGVYGTCAFLIEDNATVNLTLVGTNVLKSGCFRAGLQVKGKLNITGGENDRLDATGGYCGAGIGGGNQEAGGNISITGGIVKATSPNYGAGIGGGNNGDGGVISITGGNVEATGSSTGAGIGGGNNKAGGNIRITGGEVKATGVFYGAGIGGGKGASAEDSIVINGGIVTAKTESGVADIGNSNTIFSTTILANGSLVLGSAVITCRDKGILCSTESDARQCIVINELSKTCTVYGNNMTLNTGLTIPNDYTMTVLQGNSLIISNGVTLTNNGTISGNGTIDLSGGGSITGAAVGSGVTLKYSVKKTGSENIEFEEESDADNQQGYSTNLYAKEG